MGTLSSGDYVMSEVTENFLDGVPLNPNISKPLLQDRDFARGMVDKFKLDKLERMDVADCIRIYTPSLISQYGSVLVVYPNAGNTSLLTTDEHNVKYPAKMWMCGYRSCDPSKINPSNWDPNKGYGIRHGIYADENTPWDLAEHLYFEGNVEYCLTEKLNHPCHLEMSPPILITVLVYNAIKTLCFILTLWVVGAGYPLVTNGDVVESFLLRPDANL